MSYFFIWIILLSVVGLQNIFCESELVCLEIEVNVIIIHDKYGWVNEGFMRWF